MAATLPSRKRRLFAILALLCITVNKDGVLAHLDQPGDALSADGGPLLTNWFRRVSSSSAEGSWLWGWAWGADNTVSVVDRSPPVSFVSRPASFGRMLEDALNGYGIPMNAFTRLCDDDDGDHDDNGARFDGSGDRHRHGSSLQGQGAEAGIGPNVGCPKLCPSGNHIPEPEDAWVAVVQRGNCSFVSKVREAQRFGAKAVIVGGDDPTISGNPDVLVNMYSQSDSSDIKIPSTYIKFSDYARLANLIATSNTSTSGIKTVSIQITADYASWEWYSPILTFIVLLLLPSALTLTTLLIHRVRAARAEQRERAPEDVVNRLPWRVWTGSGWEKHEGPVPPPSSTKVSADTDLERGDVGAETTLETAPRDSAIGAVAEQCKPSTSHDENEEGRAETRSVNPPWFDAQTECAICLNDFEKGDRVRVLPCKHIFHLEEVDEWLIHRRKLCPICKADVTRPSLHHEFNHPDAHHEVLPLIPSDTSDTLTRPQSERTPLLSAPADQRSIESRSYYTRHSSPAPSRPRSPSRSVSCLFPRSDSPSPSLPSTHSSVSVRRLDARHDSSSILNASRPS